jgi:O-antigen/teichoic acid export membrane protein/phosphatidylglycerophosphate synthase
MKNTPDLSIASTRSVEKRVAANTGLMVGSKGLAALFGLLSLLIASKSISIAAVGIILFLHSYHLLFAQLATFQAWQTIIRFGMEDIHNDDSSSLAKLIKFGYKLDIISAVVAFLAAIAFFPVFIVLQDSFPAVFDQLPEEIDMRALYPTLILYCSLLLIRHRGASIGVFRLFDRFDVLAWHAVVMTGVRLIGAVIAAFIGAGMEGFLIAWFIGSLVDYIALPVLAGFELAKRNFLKQVLRIKSSVLNPRKGVWPFVWKANIDSSLAASNVHLPVLMVMAVFGPVWVTVYRWAEEIAKLLSEGFKLLDQVIYPELAKMVSAGEAEKIWRLVMRSAVILLSVGLLASLFIWLSLGSILGVFLSEEYRDVAPLASLLVPAAALLGMAAPLYPVLYATDHPERAIYARGAGVVVYIVSFFALSATIGHMAPGWAAIAGNLVAVGLVMWLAKQALDKIVKQQEDGGVSEEVPTPGFGLIGESAARIWGLSVREWQTRAFKKAGADVTLPLAVDDRGVWHHIDWIMSAELSKSFTRTDRLALVEAGVIVSLSSATKSEADALIGQPAQALSETDFRGVTPSDVNDGYIKSLRKHEPPYVIDTRTTPILDIMRRQFDSSYKGITDFVTKWFWPVPAFYVTRLCAWLRLTPNQVTTIGFFLMLAATYFFWNEYWAIGFLCGWTMTFLDTVDGKLARTTMTYSNWGNVYDHGIDLIHPPFWYWAWFIGLGGSYSFSDPLCIAFLAICVGYVVDRIIEGLFLGQHGFHIHVWTKFNSGLRFFIARRNPNTFIMMVGIILTMIWADAGYWAFIVIAVWTWVCIAANFATLVAGFFAKRPTVSWMDA